MTKGKRWSTQEEAELKALIAANLTIDEIATKINKSPGAIFVKCQRLGLKPQSCGYLARGVPLPRQLPSIEDALKILAGALEAARQPGLDKAEVQRLQAVSTIARTYKEILADYVNYREIETKLDEAQKENDQQRGQDGSSSTP